MNFYFSTLLGEQCISYFLPQYHCLLLAISKKNDRPNQSLIVDRMSLSFQSTAKVIWHDATLGRFAPAIARCHITFASFPLRLPTMLSTRTTHQRPCGPIPL